MGSSTVIAPAGAGTPTKKFAAQAGLFGSSAITLKRARRSPVEIANTMAAIQPALPSSWRPQKYSISAGATPKLTKSARLSSSAPNRDVPLRSRATRPSMPSSTAANTMAPSAHSSLPSTARRIAVSPAHNASRVMRFGTMVRTGTARNRRRRAEPWLRLKGENGEWVMATYIYGGEAPRHASRGAHFLPDFGQGGRGDSEVGWEPRARRPKKAPTLPSPKTRREKKWLGALPHPVAAAGVAAVEVGDDGFAGDRDLALGDEGPPAVREIDVHPGAEPDHADPLAGSDGGVLPHERHDASRDQAGDLHDADARPARGPDEKAVGFVVLARLVEVSMEEQAGPVGDALDPAGHGTAV